MKKFSTEEITNIISNETNIWEQFKQNMKRWEKKRKRSIVGIPTSNSRS